MQYASLQRLQNVQPISALHHEALSGSHFMPGPILVTASLIVLSYMHLGSCALRHSNILKLLCREFWMSNLSEHSS